MWCCWTSPGHNPASTRSAGRPLALSSIQADDACCLRVRARARSLCGRHQEGSFLLPASCFASQGMGTR